MVVGGNNRQRGGWIFIVIICMQVPIADDEEVKRSSDLVQLKGCVASRLFVYPDDTLEYVETLLRKDLIQSITQRINRATEQPDADDEDQKNDVIGK